MAKNIVFIILLFVTLNLFGQNKFHSIYIKGKITTDNIALSNVKINIVLDKSIDKTILNEVNGDYNFTLDPGNEYIIEYKKEGFVTKYISISTK